MSSARKGRRGPASATGRLLPFPHRLPFSPRRFFEQLEQRRLLSISPPDYAALPLSTFDAALASSQTVAASNLVGGLNALGGWASQIETFGALGTVVPITNQSAGTAVNLQDLLQTQFADAINNYLSNNTAATADELAVFLANNQWESPETGLTLSATVSTKDGGATGAELSGNDLLIGLDITATRTASTMLNLDQAASNGAPIGFTTAAAGTLTANMNFQFSFGLDVTPYLKGPAAQQIEQGNSPPANTPAAQFVLQATSLSAKADYAGTNINTAANVGLLGGNVQNGSATVHDDLTLALPGGDLHTGDFATASLDGRLTQSGLGSITATLPFQAQVGGVTFNAAVSGQTNDALSIAVTPLFNAVPAGTQTTTGTLATTGYALGGSDAAAMQSFEYVSAGDVQSGLVQLGGWAASLSSSTALGQTVPFTGQQLGQTAELETAFEQGLKAVLPGASGANNTQTPFSTVQSLVGLLPNIASVKSYSNNFLTLQFNIPDQSLPAVSTPLTLPAAGALNAFTSAGTLTLSPRGGLDFTFGINLTKVGQTLTNSTELSQLNGGKGVTFNVGLTANPFASTSGQLTSDATFDLTINKTASSAGQTYSVTLTAASTANNASLDDLVAELNSALGTALAMAKSPYAGEIEVQNDNGAIVLAATASASGGSAPITSLGVSGAGATALGFNSAGQTTGATDADLSITLHNGETQTVSLRGLGESATLSQVFQTIETATGYSATSPGVQATLYDNTANPSDPLNNRAILLTDTTSGTRQFTISAANGSLAGTAQFGLGIIGVESTAPSDSSGNSSLAAIPAGSIVSGPLDGASPLANFFVSNVSADASVSVSTPVESQSQTKITGTADLGIVPITVSADTASATIASKFTVSDPNSATDGGQLSLEKLDMAVVSTPNLSGSGSMSFTATAAAQVLTGIAPATLTVSWPATGGPSPVSIPSGSALADLARLSDSNIDAAFTDVAGYLGDAAKSTLLSTALPAVGQNVDSLLPILNSPSTFSGLVTPVTATAPATLDELLAALDKALGGTITVSLNGTSLEFKLDYTASQPKPLPNAPVNLDLKTLGSLVAGGTPSFLVGVNSLTETGKPSLAVSAGGSLNLDLGIDLSNSTVQPFLYGDTQLSLNAAATTNNVNFDAAVNKLLGVSVTGASVSTSGTFTAGLASSTTPYYFNNVTGHTPLTASSVQASATGSATASLPISGSALGTNGGGTLTVGATSLQNVLTTQAGSVTITASAGLPASLKNLASLTSSSGNTLGMLGDGLSFAFDQVQQAIVQTAFAKALPFVGNQLTTIDIEGDQWDGPLTQLQVALDGAKFTTSTEGTVLTSDITTAFGTLLKSAPVVTTSTSGVHVSMELVGSEPTMTFLFSTGLKSMPLLPQGFDDVWATVGYDLKLTFGVDKTHGFYIDGTSGGNTLSLMVHAGFGEPGSKNYSFNTTLGTLPFAATDQGSSLNGTIGVNLEHADTTGSRVYLATATSLFSADATLTGTSNINLNLALGQQGNSNSSIVTNFVENWTWTAADTKASGDFGSVTVAFNDVSINLSDFLHQLAGGFIGEVNKIVAPVEPIISFLTSPLPVLDDFGINVDLLQLLGMGDAQPFLETLGELGQLTGEITSLANSVTGPWDIGSFMIAGDPQKNGGLASETLVPYTPAKQAAPQDDNGDSQDVTDLINFTSQASIGGGGFAFPAFANNGVSLANVLLGKNVNLVTFNLPTLTVGGGFSTPPILIFPFPPVDVTFGAHISASFHFSFGFDTAGLTELQNDPSGDLFNIDQGFFINDTQPQATLSASITASAELNLIIAQFGVGGGIFGTANFYLSDPDGSGKVRLSEIEGQPLSCLFNEKGSIDAGLFAFVKIGLDLPFVGFVTIFSDTFTIATITLADFGSNGNCATNPPQPVLATPLDNGVLRLNMGPYAVARKLGDDHEQSHDESFVVGPGPVANSVTVTDTTGGGLRYGGNLVGSQTYYNVSQIVAYGGTGNNSITINSGVTAAVQISGGTGTGSDTINDSGSGSAYLLGGGTGGDTITYAGAGPATLYGSTGPDLLDDSASTGAVSLYGQGGNDTLRGGLGNDFLRAGRGTSQLFSNSAAGAGSTLQAGSGNDTLDASHSPGNNVLEGSYGSDVLYGGPGNNLLEAGWGTDQLYSYSTAGHASLLIGAVGSDTLDASGSAGNDTLEGGPGSDTITGSSGKDLIIAGTSIAMNDPATSTKQINGGTGADTIYGDTGNETITGGSGGENIIYTGSGNATVQAGPRGDSIVGGIGKDSITGGVGNDTLVSGSGSSGPGTIMQGGGGNDLLIAGQGPDSLYGGTGNDTLYGGGGHDLLVGGANVPTLPAGYGPAIANGLPVTKLIGPGQDTIYGDAGPNTIYGGSGGPNSIYSGDGDDVVFGGPKGDLIVSGDKLFGGGTVAVKENGVAVTVPNSAGNGHGNDYFQGGVGSDKIYGGFGSDTLLGGGGSDLLVAGPGGSYLDAQGGSGTPTLIGGAGSDTLVLNTEPASHPGTILGYYPSTAIDGVSNKGVPDTALTPISATATSNIQYEADDTLLINAGNLVGNGSIELGQPTWGTLSVTDSFYGATPITLPWRSATTHAPNFEQFQIDGSDGNDHIWFDQGATALDLADAHSPTPPNSGANADPLAADLLDRIDFISAIYGGAGNNTIGGTAGSDQIFGGPGSNVLYGVGGDDELYGDTIPGHIAANTGPDTLYAGTGNSDLFAGGSGSQLYAWSQDPESDAQAENELGFGDGLSAKSSGTTTVTAATIAPSAVLSLDVSFSINLIAPVSGHTAPTPTDVYVSAASTANDKSTNDLATAINAALKAAGLGGVVNGTGTDDVWAAVSAKGFLTLSTKAGYLQIITGQYGVYVDANGFLHPNSGVPAGSKETPLYTLEATGYDRMLGAVGTDSMYAGPGPSGSAALDFMFNPVGKAVIYDDAGTLAQSQSTAGQVSALEAFAQGNPGVWYVKADSTNDNIEINYGVATDVTGNSTSPFYWIEENGNILFDFSFTAAAQHAVLNVPALQGDTAYFFNPSTPPPQAIVVATGDGNDTLDVAANVAVPVWVFGGAGNDYFKVEPFDSQVGTKNGQPVYLDPQLTPPSGNTPPRNVMIAGSGNDTLLGGSGNEWLFGGSGTNWISGGPSSSSKFGNLLYGGTGPTTFQILPFDSTMSGLQPDTIVGNSGNDRLLFLGDNKTPTYVSLGYDSTKFQYVLTTLVAPQGTTSFLTNKGQLDQRYATFTASGIEHFEIAVGAAGSVVDASGLLSQVQSTGAEQLGFQIGQSAINPETPGSAAVITATAPPASNVTGDAVFALSLPGHAAPVEVDVTGTLIAKYTAGKITATALAAVVNAALANAKIGTEVIAGVNSGQLTLTTSDKSIAIVPVFTLSNTPGIQPGDYEQGAPIVNLDIRAAAGDTVFGGAGDDTISGGGGGLFVGNGGNNTVLGGTQLEQGPDGSLNFVNGTAASGDQLYGHNYPTTLVPAITTTSGADQGAATFNPTVDFPNPATSLWFTDPPLVVQSQNNHLVPAVPPPGVTLPGSGAAGAPSGPQPISNAFSLTGIAPSQIEDVGDVTGNGIDDYLVTDGNPSDASSNIFVLFGPVNFKNNEALAQQADLVGSVATLGQPALNMGDVNGDGINDLVFVKQTTAVQPGDTFTFTTFFGGPTLAHSLALPNPNATVTTLTDGYVGANATMQLLNFYGNGQRQILLTGDDGSELYQVDHVLLQSMSTAVPIFQVPSHVAGALSATVIPNFQGGQRDEIAYRDSSTDTVRLVSSNSLPPVTLSCAVGEWNGDGNFDDSIGGDNASVHTAVAFVPGVTGQAFSFTSAYVEVPSTAALQPSTVTVAAWLNAISPLTFAYIVDKGDSYALATPATGGLVFAIFNGHSTGSSGFVFSPDAGTGIWNGQWHFVVGTFDGATVRLYVDGNQVAAGTPDSANVQIGYDDSAGSTNDLFLGGYGGPGHGGAAVSNFFDGSVGNVQIYNRALSAAEVQSLFDTRSGQVAAALPPGAVGWWRADGNANDSVDGNFGTLQSGVTYTAGAPGTGDQAFDFNENTSTVGAAVDVSSSLPNSAALQPTTVSVAAWVYDANAPGAFAFAVDKGDSYALETPATGGLVFAIFNGHSTGSSGFVFSPDAGTGIWTGQWHFVVGTFDGATARLYVDGNQVGTGTANTSNIQIGYGSGTTNDLFLGGYGGPGHTGTAVSNFFNGLVGDVQIYGRALSAAEIIALYAQSGVPVDVSQTSPTSSFSPIPVSRVFPLGDINRDGYSDFAVVQGGANPGILVFEGNAHGSLNPGVTFALPGAFSASLNVSDVSVTVGDFNGDGEMDLAIALPDATNADGSKGAVYVAWSAFTTANPTFTEEVTGVAATNATPDIDITGLAGSPQIDVNGDGIDDLLVEASGGVTAGAVYVIYGAPVVYPQAVAAGQAAPVSHLLENNPTSHGEYLDGSKSGGAPFSSNETLAAGQGSDWFSFTTQGDGQAQNSIVLSPGSRGTQTTWLTPTTGTLVPDPKAAAGGYDVTPTALAVGNGASDAYDFTGGNVGFNIPQLNTAAGGSSTVSFWMKWDGSDGGGDVPVAFGSAGSFYDLFLHDGFFGFNTYNGDIFGTSLAGLANGWHLVTAVFASANGSQDAITQDQLWIDGAPRILAQEVGTPLTSNERVSATGSISLSGNSFSGELADVAFFNSALTAAQIQAQYAAVATHSFDSMILSQGPVAYYRLDETSGGATAFDSSSNGNNATISGSVLLAAAGPPAVQNVSSASGVVELDLSSLLPYMNTPSVIQNVTLALNYDNVVGGGTLNLSVLDDGQTVTAADGSVKTADLLKGDGVVNSLDIVNPATGNAVPSTQLYSWQLSSLAASGVLTTTVVGNVHPTGIDLTALVLAALAQGKTRLTLRFDLVPASGTTASVELLPPDPRAATQTDLAITTAVPGVEGELFNAAGAHVGATGPVIDMAGLPAGTYYLHVFDPSVATPLAPVGWASPTTTLIAPPQDAVRNTRLAYTITIAPPVAGQNNPPLIPRALVYSGGMNMLVGGSGIDKLLGNITTDKFEGTPAEPRDIGGTGQSATPATPPGSLPTAASDDPAVAIPDFGLEEAIADASGIAWTTGYNGAPILARPILASDIAQITSLEASNFNVANLAGLQYATNLTSLYLVNDALTSLEMPPSPWTSPPPPPGTLDPIGQVLPQLKYLVLDNNKVGDGDLGALSGMSSLIGLNLDDNTITDLGDLPALPSLEYLSADGRPESSASFSLAGVAPTDIQDVGNLTGNGIDDYLITDASGAIYVLFGPVTFQGDTAISQQAEYVGNTATLGQPALKMGDLNGDGINDLVFMQQQPDKNGDYDFTTFLGGPNVAQTLLTGAIISTIPDAGISSGAGSGPDATAQVVNGNWTAGPAGSFTSGLLLSGPQGSEVLPPEDFTVSSNGEWAISTLYNTGESSNGEPIAPGSADPHYTRPAGEVPGNAYAEYVSPWVVPPTGANYQWIAPYNTAGVDFGLGYVNGYNYAPTGNYAYVTTFDLTGFNYTSATISGRVAADDSVIQVYLNTNTNVPFPGEGSEMNTSWTTFTYSPAELVTEGIQAGGNQLVFVVDNFGQSPNPSGLMVDFTNATAVAVGSYVPAPSPPANTVLNAELTDVGNYTEDGADTIVESQVATTTVTGTTTTSSSIAAWPPADSPSWSPFPASAPISAVFPLGDVNHDGYTDFAVAVGGTPATNFTTGTSPEILIFEGNAQGTLAPTVTISVAAPLATTFDEDLSTLSITEGDFNLDGQVDLAVALPPATTGDTGGVYIILSPFLPGASPTLSAASLVLSGQATNPSAPEVDITGLADIPQSGANGQGQGVLLVTTKNGAASTGAIDAIFGYYGVRETDVTSLSGLAQSTPALQTLSAAHQQVSDITGLSGLAQLQNVLLDDNEITDISPLAALPNLQNAAVHANPLDNASIAAAEADSAVIRFDGNSPPTLAPIPSQSINGLIDLLDSGVGSLPLTVSASDPDGDPLFYKATTDNPDVTVSYDGTNLSLSATNPAFSGTVQVTLTVHDGPSGPGDWRGMTDSQTFDLNVGVGEIDGSLLPVANTAPLGAAGLAGWTVTLNYSGQQQQTMTDAAGNYSLGNLTLSNGGLVASPSPTVTVAPPANSGWVVDGATEVQLSPAANQTLDQGNFNVFQIVSAGPGTTGIEGTAVSLTGTVQDPPAGDQENYATAGATATWTISGPSGSTTNAAGLTWSTGSNGVLTASAPLTFTPTAPGTYDATLTVAYGSANAVSTASIVVADALLSANAVTFTPTEGATFSGTVATFTDAGGSAPATNYSATIVWGDGTTSAGTISEIAGGTPTPQFTVTGSHLYAEEGTQAVNVTIADTGGSTATVTSSAQIDDASLTAKSLTFTATEGKTFSGTVATFTDTDPAGAVGDYTATIVWGDGATTTGKIATVSGGGFAVTGSHVYTEEGTLLAKVTIADHGGSTVATVSTAKIADAALTAKALTITPTEGKTFSGTLATFTDADAAGANGDYTATIVWGDGATTAGIVTAVASGGFAVSGNHAYAEERTATIKVTIADHGGSKATATSTAVVTDAALAAKAPTVTPTEGNTFSGTVATFTDADPGGAVGDFTATIVWGDGATTTGAITEVAGGGFAVKGSHLYTTTGTDTVKVIITDSGGSNATATSTANVSAATKALAAKDAFFGELGGG